MFKNLFESNEQRLERERIERLRNELVRDTKDLYDDFMKTYNPRGGKFNAYGGAAVTVGLAVGLGALMGMRPRNFNGMGNRIKFEKAEHKANHYKVFLIEKGASEGNAEIIANVTCMREFLK